MEVTDGNLATLAQYLQQTLSPDLNIRKPAEKFLEGIEVNQNYPVLLLTLINKNEVDMTIRVAGAVSFKNYIKRNWSVEEDETDRIFPSDRVAIKQFIITLMLSSPEAIQKQLSDAISIIGKTDFPTKWPELIEQMVEKFATGDFHVINGVLRTAHSLFKKYRYEFRSNELFTEIKFVLEKLAQPLTDLLKATMDLANTHANNEASLKIIYSSLLLVSKVFYSLNFQDLPEFFEDNMSTWMSCFHTLLTSNAACLRTEGDEEAGVIEELKSQVCFNITLYAQKYDEEFRPFLPQFVTDVWSLLVSTGLQVKYDSLVSNSLQFLSSVASRNHYRSLFEEPNVLDSICKNVIIPNMEFRACDEELFEDDPEEYIRRDIEGSDIDTRRRAACDLVSVLSKEFEQKVMEIFGQYLQVMLSKYAENPSLNWRSKDAAMYLVTSIASRGQTEKHGVTQTNQLVPLPQFFQQQVLPELERANVDELPVLKADAIKYIITFRSVLPPEMVVPTILQLIRHLQSNNVVTHTYAACAIEKILLLRATGSNGPLITSNDLAPLAGDTLSGLFSILDKEGSTENEYVMKAIMRCFSTLQDKVIPYLSSLLPKLTDKLQIVTKNPSKPHFNHYLFETFSLSIRIVCKQTPTAVASFEDALFPIFQVILQQDIQEFIPYVFQLLSLMIELNPSGTVPEPYMQLLPFLLAPVLWERPANCSPLVRLLSAFIMYASSQILAQDKLNGVLGVFQKLIASKNNDHEGFALLRGIVLNIPPESLQQYQKRIFFLLFQRLSSSKTTKYVIGLISFFCLYMVKFSPSALISIIDGIQAQMFGMVIEKVLLPDLQKVCNPIDRKTAACGIIKLLCECTETFSGLYQKYWCPLLEALLNFFELPVDETLFPDDHFVEIDETPAYTASSAKLNFASSKKTDPLEVISEPRQFLVENLKNLGNQYPGQIPAKINSINQQYSVVLQGYCSKFGVQLV